jgi:hypothetical protein
MSAITFDSCDIILEDDAATNHILIFANEIGRVAILGLFPTVPIDWETRSGIPSEWRLKTITLTDKAELVPNNIVGLGIALMRAECRVAIKKGDLLELLSDENDIQKFRPH